MFYSKPKSRFHTLGDFPGDLQSKIKFSLHSLHDGLIAVYLICTFRDMIRAEGDRNQASDRSVSHLSGFCSFRSPEKSADFFMKNASSPFCLSEGFRLISGYLEKSASSSSTVLLFVNLKQKRCSNHLRCR